MPEPRFTAAQVAQLLKPIASQRVLSDGKGHSHVSQQDVTAHLIRMFGFGGFDTKLLSLDCVFANERTKDGKPSGRWDVCYSATMRLTVKNEGGQPIAEYEDGSTATAQNQTLGDAHDLAMKSAISLAKKRCAINLGDQFGLSLYNKGQRDALVIGTLVGAEDKPAGDVQQGVPQQLAMGNDETDYEPGNGESTQAQQDRRNNDPTPAELRGQIASLGAQAGMAPAEIKDDFAQFSQGGDIRGDDVPMLAKYRDSLKKVA